MAVVIIENEQGNRFDIVVDDVVAGHILITLQDGSMDITSTVVDPAFGGRGLGARLVRHALDVARIRNLSVIPTCPFVPKVILSHRELYLDLVATDKRSKFGLPNENVSDL